MPLVINGRPLKSINQFYNIIKKVVPKSFEEKESFIMQKKCITLAVLFTLVVLAACNSGPSQEEIQATIEAGIEATKEAGEEKATEIAGEVFATQTSEAGTMTADAPTPTDTATPMPTDTATPEATDMPTVTATPAETATPVNTPTPAATATPVDTPTPLPPTATPTSAYNWVQVADSAADFPGPIQGRKWWYLWSEGRRNFFWQDMHEMANTCYKVPNDMKMEICRDTMTFDPHGDAALQWKAQEGGKYLFEWDAKNEGSIQFWKHLDYYGNQGEGLELPYGAIVENVIEWELFFFVPTENTHYRVKVYKLVE
jgi:hypothetical protein